MLSPVVLYFILIWVSPGLFMVLFQYPTRKYDGYVGLFLIMSILIIPLSVLVYGIYPPTRLLLMYVCATSYLTYIINRVFDYPLPQAFSLSSMACLLSSFYWELPWLIRNAIIVGWEDDWIIHSLGLFFLWFLIKAVGFKKEVKSIFILLIVLAVSTVWMLYTNLPPGLNDPLIWNNYPFMAIRISSIIAVVKSLNLVKQDGHVIVLEITKKEDSI